MSRSSVPGNSSADFAIHTLLNDIGECSWPLLTCQGESVAEAERHADGAAPEIEHLLRERLIEERVVDRILVVDGLEPAEVADVGANADASGGQQVRAGADVVAAVVAGQLVEDVTLAAQLRPDAAEARRHIWTERAVGAAHWQRQHDVPHQRLHARIEVEQVEVVGAAGELEEVRRRTVIPLDAED